MTSPNPLHVVAGYVRRFLALEPAVIAAFVRALVGVAAAVGIVLPGDLEGRTVLIFAAVVLLSEIATTIYTRVRATPVAKVVEQLATDGVTVIAGPANNQVETGVAVRDHDAPPRAPGDELTRREYRAQHPTD